MSAAVELNRRFEDERQREYLGVYKPVNKILPLVSVSVATYQHINYIKRCVEGILMQKTSFPIEIIIGDDGSEDGTTEICKDYARQYPNLIRLFIRDRKTSQYYENGKFICRFNGVWCRMSCRGKYIAWCEGDDYWTDPLKLQEQVDFLERNTKYVVCHHSFSIQDENGNEVSSYYPPNNFDFTPKQLASGAFMKTNTLLFRNVELNYPTKALMIANGDTYLIAQLAKYGYAKYLPDILPSVYTIHKGGIWSPLDNNKKLYKQIETFEVIKENIPYRLKREVNKTLFNLYFIRFNTERNSRSKFKNVLDLLMLFKKYPFLLIQEVLNKALK